MDRAPMTQAQYEQEYWAFRVYFTMPKTGCVLHVDKRGKGMTAERAVELVGDYLVEAFPISKPVVGDVEALYGAAR